MEIPMRLLPYTAVIFVCSVASIVGFRLLTGAIVTRGLVSGPDGRVSALKVQMLMATVTSAAIYAARIADNGHSGALPPVDRELLYVTSGSNGLLLARVVFDRLVSAFRSDSKQRNT